MKKGRTHIQKRMIEVIINYDPMLHMVKRRKLKWYGHISIYDSLRKTIMQGMAECWKNKVAEETMVRYYS